MCSQTFQCNKTFLIRVYDVYLFFAYMRFATNTMPTGIIVQNVMYVNNKLIEDSRKNADAAKNWI